MITVNDKLKLFTKRIIDLQQKTYDEKVESLEKQMVIDLEERKKVLLRDRKKYETTLLKGINNERASRLSNARSERKRRLLLKRKEMIDELLEGVKAYTKNFVHTDDYILYMKQTIQKHNRVIKALGEFDFLVNERDLKYKEVFEDLFKSLDLNCLKVSVCEKKILGGAIIVKSDRSSRLDLSLDSVIEDNKKYMGQLIYDMLEEAGEFSGKQS
jgi:vacuolar-type H+-ATPase subunit E/Vma4